MTTTSKRPKGVCSRKLTEKRSAGFSLVEVCLALAVVGIGLLAVFSLFPAGLSMNKKNTDATVCTMFAEEVFNGLHAVVDNDPSKWIPETNWEAGWETDEDMKLPLVARDIWDGGESTSGGLDLSGEMASRRLVNLGGFEDGYVRYRFHFITDPDFPENRLRRASLIVWNGEYGRDDEEGGYRFMTTFYNFGFDL